MSATANDTERPGQERQVDIAVSHDGADATILAELVVPPDAIGAVLFAHGSGSSRLSPRNRQVAAALQQRGLATMLADLLTSEEEHATDSRQHPRFDVRLLADRLVAATRWLTDDPATAALPVGYFGASTGAAAALVAAAEGASRVRAVVSRGGRPDLAGDALRAVLCPTLLIVGGRDSTVVELNSTALTQLSAASDLRVVQGATHLFEEPGALEEVARLAGDWFVTHLTA